MARCLHGAQSSLQGPTLVVCGFCGTDCERFCLTKTRFIYWRWQVFGQYGLLYMIFRSRSCFSPLSGPILGQGVT